MTKGEIINIIRASPLEDEEIAEIIAACTTVTLSNALIGAGMDLLADKMGAALDIVTGEGCV